MSAFTPAGSGGAPATPVTISGATTPSITLIAMLLAATEYPVILPIGTKQYRLRLLDGQGLDVSYETGGPIQQIPRFCFLAEGGLSLITPITLYLSSSSAAQMAEIVVWI